MQLTFYVSKLTNLLTSAAIALAVVGCGGSVSSAQPPRGDTVSGLAAVGTPVAGAQVDLKCAHTVSGRTTANAVGRWTVGLASPQYPCLATLTSGDLTLRSLALAMDHLNSTPMSQLMLARAAARSDLHMDEITGLALSALATSVSETQAAVVTMLIAQGFPVDGIDMFSGEFNATKGDNYDDLFEHIDLSLKENDLTLHDLITVMVEGDARDPPVLANTLILHNEAIGAMPQLNNATLAITDGSLKMALGGDAPRVSAFVGSGTGNKGGLKLAGLNRVKLRDLHSVTVNLQGDAGGVTAPPVSPYVFLNLTIDLACSGQPVAGNTLADLRAQRRILSFDPYYHFITCSGGASQRLSATEPTTLTTTPSTPGWRVSDGMPMCVLITPNYNGSNSLDGFDYDMNPDACIVDGATDDAGMFRTQKTTCMTGAALVGTDRVQCGLLYSGALLFLGSISGTEVSHWSVNEVTFFRKVAPSNVARAPDAVRKTFRTFRFEQGLRPKPFPHGLGLLLNHQRQPASFFLPVASLATVCS